MMVFDTTVQDKNSLPQMPYGIIKTLLMLSAGVAIGLIAAERGFTPPMSVDFLQTGEIAGQNWHGNVRRSSPAQ